MSSDDYAIRVENLSKYYAIYSQPQDRLKQSIIPRLQQLAGITPKKYFHEFWALKNVSFEVNRGETMGIIGRNGSGKSTLLQLICGTLSPTTGNVYTNGRVAALLELGSGFNPEFSGRENVYLNGALLGMSHEEIDSSFDDIAAFADIGEFIEQPVKMYSSGMFVRLAFAINIMSQPDILIVDEALSVGDINFQAKCMTAMKRRQDAGMTILFVSHDIGTVRSLCSRGIYLEHGEVKALGKASFVTDNYLRVMREEMNAEQAKKTEVKKVTRLENKFPDQSAIAAENSESSTDAERTYFNKIKEFEHRVAQFRYGSGEARITYVELLDEQEIPTTFIEFNQYIKIRIYLQGLLGIENVSVNYNIADDKKNNVTGADLLLLGRSFIDIKAGESYCAEYSMRLPLQEGMYSIRVSLSQYIIFDETVRFVDFIEDAVVFRVARRPGGRLWAKVHLFPSMEIKLLSLENAVDEA
jgi:lipopolysaccharide transport system ATP-binding protein